MRQRHHVVALPKRLTDVSVADMWDFIRIIHWELESGNLSDEERQKLLHITQGFGIIFSRQAYFRQAYCRPMMNAVQTIFQRFPRARVLDVGCGTGTQSVLFAALGGSVVGLDHDELQLQTARHRTANYEQQLTRRLDVDYQQADLRDYDFTSHRGFHAFYSHGCITRLLSAEEIFRAAQQVLAPGGLIILKACNPSYLVTRALRLPTDRSTAAQLRAAGQKYGFRPLAIRGTTAIPRAFWVLGEMTQLLDAPLRNFLPFAVHLEVIFERVE